MNMALLYVDEPADIGRLINIVLYLLTSIGMLAVTYRLYPSMQLDEVIAREGITLVFCASIYASIDNLLPGPPNPWRVWLLVPGLLMTTGGFLHWRHRLPRRRSTWWARIRDGLRPPR